MWILALLITFGSFGLAVSSDSNAGGPLAECRAIVAEKAERIGQLEFIIANPKATRSSVPVVPRSSHTPTRPVQKQY